MGFGVSIIIKQSNNKMNKQELEVAVERADDILHKIVRMTPEEMTPEEKFLFDKGVEEMKGEICSIHGDVCECSQDTKMEGWILQGTVRFIMENSTVCDPEEADFVVRQNTLISLIAPC